MMVKLCNYSANHMRAEPGKQLARTDYGSTTNPILHRTSCNVTIVDAHIAISMIKIIHRAALIKNKCMYIRYRVPTVMEISIVSPFNESSNRITYNEFVSESVKIKCIKMICKNP